ncbi:hypothetical protein [Paenibacillus sp. OSY-SE]|uniref:hypothetical protein n=1 Tax=Paenibacillus sp. OSY-SE TaxID=1196323 RepID=UPI0002D58A76|nr:hypothetical protein [Paenibacillus sp. OSY-SE]
MVKKMEHVIGELRRLGERLAEGCRRSQESNGWQRGWSGWEAYAAFYLWRSLVDDDPKASTDELA